MDVFNVDNAQRIHLLRQQTNLWIKNPLADELTN